MSPASYQTAPSRNVGALSADYEYRTHDRVCQQGHIESTFLLEGWTKVTGTLVQLLDKGTCYLCPATLQIIDNRR